LKRSISWREERKARQPDNHIMPEVSVYIPGLAAQNEYRIT
jgi:hypothetical protein